MIASSGQSADYPLLIRREGHSLRRIERHTWGSKAILSRLSHVLTLLIITSQIFLTASKALAGEDEMTLYLQPSAGLWLAEAVDARWGGRLGANIGLSPSLSLAIEAGGNTGSLAPAANFDLQGGLVMALDLFRTVPFLEVLTGVEYGVGRFTPLLTFGLGAEYLITPSWSIGLLGRIPLLQGAPSTPALRPQLGLRLGWRHDL